MVKKIFEKALYSKPICFILIVVLAYVDWVQLGKVGEKIKRLSEQEESRQLSRNSYTESQIIVENTKKVLNGKFLFDGKIYISELSANEIVDEPVFFKSEHFVGDNMVELQPFQCVQEDTGEKVICYFLFTDNISPEIKAVGKMPDKAKAEEKTPTN